MEGEGPRYRQTSNAYRPLLPARVLAYLPRWMRPAPLSVDHGQHRAVEAEAHKRMLASLSCRERATASVGGILGEVLASLGAAIDRDMASARESQNHPQPLMDSI